jgi:hypothetical protein
LWLPKAKARFPKLKGGFAKMIGFLVGSTLAVVDVLGKVIYTRAINNSQTELNVSDLTSGIYFIQITDNGALLGTKKLIVE